MLENKLNHKEIIKYLCDFFKDNHINDFEYSHKDYSEEPVYGLKIDHQYSKFSRLYAPFGIGNIKIYIYDDRVAFKYVTYFKRYFDFNDELGYKLYGPVVDLMQDFWYIMIPELNFDDFAWDNKYGGLLGCEINNHTKEHIDKFLNKIFVEKPFDIDDKTRNIALEYINQFDDYSSNYSPTAFCDFLKYVGKLWYSNNWLWSTIPFMTHRADDIDKYDIERLIFKH